MKRKRFTYYLSYLFAGLLLLLAGTSKADDGSDALDRTIRLSKSKDTIYRLLGEVSEQSGFLFIYDSKIIDNEKKVSVKSGEYTIRQAIYQITGNDRLILRVIGNHILLSLPAETAPAPVPLPAPESRKKKSISYWKVPCKINRPATR